MKQLLFFLTVASLTVSVQHPLQLVAENQKYDTFALYLNCFTECSYPYMFTNDESISSSQMAIMLNPIPLKLQHEFIYSQGFKKETFFCDTAYFEGYEALLVFPHYNTFQLLAISPIAQEAFCNLATYLVCYNEYGQVTDYLVVSATGYSTKYHGYLNITTEITADSILMATTIDKYPPKETVHTKTWDRENILTKYHLSTQGKFILLTEKTEKSTRIEKVGNKK